MAGTLGQWFIEVSLKGAEVAKAGVAALTAKAKEAAGTLGGAFATAGKLASGALLGLASAGLVGTAEGNRLAFAWQQLSRQIAAVALPAFQAITDTLMKLVLAFRELTGAMQDSLLAWGGLAVGVGLVATGIGVIPGLFLAAFSAWALFKDSITGNKMFGGLQEAFTGLMTTVGELAEKLKPLFTVLVSVLIESLTVIIKLINNTVEVIARAVSFLKDAWDFVRKMNPLGYTQGTTVTDKKLPGFEDKKRRDVTPAGGRFESITSSYSRIQSAVSQVDVPKQQLAAQLEANGSLAQIASSNQAIAGKVGALLPGA